MLFYANVRIFGQLVTIIYGPFDIFMIFQAKKRKMGLLEEDEKEQNVNEIKGNDDSTRIVKAPRGKLILLRRLICSW